MNFEELILELSLKRRSKHLQDQFLLSQALKGLGNPQKKYPAVHVAGTNGKGSVSTKLAKVFEESGYRAALFTSPHLYHFEERIQVNGALIPQAFILEHLPFLLTHYPNLSFFDYTTLLGLDYFAEEKVDIAIIEAGMGGLYDSTNCIMPLLSVITTIALDHQDVLGSSLEEIAFQKCGIIKPLTPVVLGPKAARESVINTAKELYAPCYITPFQEGSYQEENKQIAQVAIDQLKSYFHLDPVAIQKGLRVNPPCRFETIGRFTLDVAHNPEGFSSLIKMWDQSYPGRPINSIVSLSLDKDLENCLLQLANRSQHIFLVQASTSRSAPTPLLAEILTKNNRTHFTACQTVESALSQALACKPDILVCGSFYIMKDIREKILRL
ncbi:bifunctional folylpolyglutamate synthase/dihydrofolate synthase [Rhabdochlamydiaceae symbiont of Dictyostelium giganteum]|uniref:bifunctional folylpolyglutamate synthase/dihydrofolate synthase n=1 Tax=Rhabdochlamydiaceae symbiont of Dictyostelium giganteum TaxID=3342349 RepID=UPI003850E153